MKRLFDLAVATAAIVVLAPVMAAVAAAILVCDGRPLFFEQVRAGKDGRSFVLRKFRTMSTESEDPTTDSERITRLGRVLRSSSLDELPTLLSVVGGDMSIVGPRPLPIRYVDRYSAEQRRRLEVRPGITGLAQVRGRNLLSWEERFELDVEYVDTRSFRCDLRIIVDTVASVAGRHGVEADTGATSEEFWPPETNRCP